MRKLFIILTLTISSFFLFSLNEVNAATFTYELTDSSFSLLNNSFYEFREKVLEYVEKNNLDGYLIYYNDYARDYYAYVTNDNYNIYLEPQVSVKQLVYKLKNFTNVKLDSSNEIVIDSVLTSYNGYYYLNSSTKLDYYIDSNLSLTSFDKEAGYDKMAGNNFIITYNDLTYDIKAGTVAPSLYQIYLDSTVVVDPYEDEKEMIGNFYSTVAIKIGELATSFASNYIFLVILGIFIYILVFELIRRYFL